MQKYMLSETGNLCVFFVVWVWLTILAWCVIKEYNMGQESSETDSLLGSHDTQVMFIPHYN